MTDRPILFSGPMVRALLADRKTQTRRDLTKTFARYPQLDGYETNGTLKPIDGRSVPCVEFIHSKLGLWHPEENPKGRSGWYVPLKAAVGDRLWVRESFRGSKGYDAHRPSTWSHWPVHYEAEGAPDPRDELEMNGRLRPGIHMPRWASRLTLIVIDVRVERLQDISEEDAVAEGMRRVTRGGMNGYEYHGQHWATHVDGENAVCWPTAKDSYAQLWDQINGRGAWEANPWVAAYTFSVIKQNIDQIARAA